MFMFYVYADRASYLKRLEIAYWYSNKVETWTEALKKFSSSLKKFSSLEEPSLHQTGLSDYNVKTLGRHCPLLKILKVNIDPRLVDEVSCDDFSKAIGKNLPELRHLELIGDALSNIGLKAILDGCCHLETLDVLNVGIISLILMIMDLPTIIWIITAYDDNSNFEDLPEMLNNML
ncbi:F-box domain containing protein [Tanacetum coccineum]